jgi:hypothetical protein
VQWFPLCILVAAGLEHTAFKTRDPFDSEYEFTTTTDQSCNKITLKLVSDKCGSKQLVVA